MGRPQSAGMTYFPHDTDASSDEKIRTLELKFGNNGYAVYFKILERIFRGSSGEYDLKLNENLRILSKFCNISSKKLLVIVDEAVSAGCFDILTYKESKILTSNGIKRRFHHINKRRERYRGENYGDTKTRTETHTKTYTETDTETPPKSSTETCKVKKSKVKKSKVKNIEIVHFPPSLDSVLELFRERNYLNPESESRRFFDYYESNGWKVGKNPMKKWESAAANWNRRNETDQPEDNEAVNRRYKQLYGDK